ncbi:Transposase [Nonomuraea solani]|uniref:Transposase n=1 Tax=Nonomuraea solani TaxID=1144553 RepID=A0A1H6DXR4_9ACTN|nr:transposase [Nonomuraea solani]SEG89513.1 Transposase [Nonomuraea solani]
MLVRDRLGEIFEDEEFAGWYPVDGRPSLSAAQLALVSVLQFTEDYSDRQAARAVAVRIDWKYALGLELEDTGFDYSVLCEFRARLAEQPERADRLLGMMLDRLHAAGLVRGRGRQRTDATHVLAAVRQVSRLELAGESVRAALEELTEAAPAWLAPLIEPEWARRYGRRVEIGRVPGGKQAIIARAEQIGRDGLKILQAVWADDAPPRLRGLPQVEILRQVWLHHYCTDEHGALRWREGSTLPPASLRFDSPYDVDAHWCVKRGTEWSGYRVHLTETCDDDLPHLVVHVATTIAPVQDGQLTEHIHDDLATSRLAPAEHVVDAAYLSPARIQRADQVHDIALLGPIAPDPSAQAKAGSGFDKSAFVIDWEHQVPSARAARPAAVGDRYGSKDTTTSRSASTPPPAGPARSVPRARHRPTGPAHWRCCPARCTRSRPETAPTRQIQHGRPATPSAPGANRPSLRMSGFAGYVAPATEGWPRPTFSTCSPPWPAMWPAWVTG